MTSRISYTLGFWLVVWCSSWVQTAHAESALFASSEARASELLPELTLALRGHGVLLLAHGIGDARTPLERAAAAQRIGRNLGAAAALWIEREPPQRVRAVGLSGERIYEAPLPAPIDTVDARVFASVASSVLLEALGRAPSSEATPALELVKEPAASPTLNAAPAASWSAHGEPARSHDDLPQRFFLRAGLTAGLVYLGKGATPDRSVAGALNEVSSSSRRSDGTLDANLAKQQLAARGYDCRVAATPEDQLQLSHCGVGTSPGFVGALALDLALGARITPRLALAGTGRIAPNAGRGALAHALFGLQLEVALLAPHATGWWLNALAGLGVGRIQAQPNSHSGGSAGPYATSGLGNARVGVQVGYRFTPNLGVYAGPVLQVGFPIKLFALEPSFGLEARL